MIACCLSTDVSAPSKIGILIFISCRKCLFEELVVLFKKAFMKICQDYRKFHFPNVTKNI